MNSLIVIKTIATVLTFGTVGIVLVGLIIMAIEIPKAKEEKTFSDWGEE